MKDAHNKRTTELTNRSNHQIVQTELFEQRPKKRSEMSTAERLQLLQRKLYLKAKQESKYQFYILYDKLFLDYVIEEAYKRAKKAAGSPGIDKQAFTDIEKNGREQFLNDLKEELRKRTYKAQPVKRVWIEKANGGKRPLGIPTIRDRVVQTACKMIIEPIFEADFEDTSHGFRPNRSAQGAIKQIKGHLQTGKIAVYDADLSKYFDTIPHDNLMKTLSLRIADSRVLHLITQWLKAPVIEDGKTTGGKKSTKGTPQGGVISPLLANIYLHLLDRIVNNPRGVFAKYQIKMVRYADDFVLMGREINEECLGRLKDVLDRMELTINETKSRLVKARNEPFKFLGFEMRYDRSVIREGTRFWNVRPSDSSRKKIRQKLNTKLKAIGHYPPERVVDELNPIIRGWINYFTIEQVSYMQVDQRKLTDYLRVRLSRYYHRKSQRKSRLHGQQAFDRLVKEYGLINPYKTQGRRPVYA